MFKNYFNVAWRNLIKNRTFGIINIVGLSFSVAFCLLLFFYIRHEQTFDNFHKKKDSLFRFESTSTFPSLKPKPKNSIFSFLRQDDVVENQLVTPLVIGRDILQTFPEVKSITRFQSNSDGFVKTNNRVYKEKNILYAEDNFFNNFSFPIINGDPKALNASPKNAILSESTAKKYFGNINPIGKTLSFMGDSARLFTVAAIAKDAPENSSIQYNIVLPLIADPGYEENIAQRFNQSSHLLIIELKDGVSYTAFETKLNAWSKKYFLEPFISDYGKYIKDVDFANYKWELRPLVQCHYNTSTPWGHYTDSKNMYQLACLVIIILLIASLNYVLLAISNASSRSQEVGVRKVMGANRSAIIMQFWVETQIVVFISVICGLLLTNLLVPFFNGMIGSELKFNEFSWNEIIPTILALSLILGILSGYYPALVISRMKPVSIVKSFRTMKINPNFSKLLVILQYTACVVLMISAFIINRQMHYINHKDLGFDKEQVLIVNNPNWGDFNDTQRLKSQLGDFAKTQPFITMYSGMNGNLDGSYNTNGFKLNGIQQWRKVFTVDFDYFEMLGLKFVQGRPFSRDFPEDTLRKQQSAVINETLFNLLGDSVKLGQYCAPIHATVIGVVKDYHFESLSKKIEPEEHVLAKNYLSHFMFKISPGMMQEAISKIGKEWKQISEYPFEYTFLDESISKMYQSDLEWQKTIQASCLFAIFIACMGLFGLSSINAINRTKEIGIRKVLGASVKDIVATLSSGFFFMVTIAILIATPIAYWVMDKWLEDFAYRIDIKWWMFLIMGILSLVIALATVSFQAIKAAVANPVKSLSTE